VRLSLPQLLLAASLALVPSAGHAAVVINEVDYDQPGTDTAEFIELRNNGPAAVDLGTYTLDLVNGNNGLIYTTVTLPSVSLAAGGYYVIAFGSANTWHSDFIASPLDNGVQNGSPDAIGLRDGGVLVDAVSYEGDTAAPYTEGAGTLAADDNVTPSLGLSRFPDGQDTNDNSADWSLRCITPGAPNTSSASGCASPVSASAPTWGALKSLYR
jgi:hypothetical protein